MYCSKDTADFEKNFHKQADALGLYKKLDRANKLLRASQKFPFQGYISKTASNAIGSAFGTQPPGVATVSKLVSDISEACMDYSQHRYKLELEKINTEILDDVCLYLIVYNNLFFILFISLRSLRFLDIFSPRHLVVRQVTTILFSFKPF